MPHIEQEHAEAQQIPLEIIPTGRTFAEMSEELKQGLPQPQNRRCYLCQRKEGDPGVCLTKDGNDLTYTKVTLDSYGIDFLGCVKTRYYLCFECYILLTNLGVLSNES